MRCIIVGTLRSVLLPTKRQAYRTSEAVDISVTGNQDGFNVGWTRPGEFLRYTVNVVTPGQGLRLRRWPVSYGMDSLRARSIPFC